MKAKTIKGKSTAEIEKALARSMVDVLILFSCVSRYLSFGLLMTEEIKQVQQVWDAPMVARKEK